jgi:signal transduction histidine kinase
MRPKTWSLRRRLLTMVGTATLLAWCTSSVWLYRSAVTEADQMFDAALDHTAHSVLAVVRNEASELTETKGAIGYELAVIDQSEQSDVLYQVRGPNGVLVFRSHGAPVAPLARPTDRGFGYSSVDGRDYRVFTLATELNAATIHVAQPMERRNALARAGAVRLLAPGAGLMLALVLAVYWSVHRTTAPVVRYAKALDERLPEVDTKVDGSDLPQELQSVARAIDGLLARVHDALLRERTVTADAAHELRTPLTALRLQAQVARRSHDDDERSSALDELLAGADRAARMVDSVLTLARLDARSGERIGGAGVEVGGLARLLVREFTPLAERSGIAVALESAHADARGDADAMAIALRNLISNALRFARTRVEILVTSDDRNVFIAIRDDGPGFNAESAGRAFHRFFRGSETGRQSDGAGLGLALVLRVVQLHGGAVRRGPGIDGGAGVELQFDRHFAGVPR